jgi:alkaline phosphatase
MRNLLTFALLSALTLSAAQPAAQPTGNVIFLHPDGCATAAWMALRYLDHGPDGKTHWDQLPHVALYEGRMTDALTSSSNGGATVHAYGTRVPRASYGTFDKKPLTALSGQPRSLAHEALAAGKRVALVNSSALMEPGTGAFIASVDDRKDEAAIAAQLADSGVHIMLGGGETWFLPKGTSGRHGPGSRTDGRNLIAELRTKGYTVIFTRDELLSLPASTEKVLGLFAAADTFNEASEEQLQRAGLPLFQPQAPSSGEMVAAALKLLATASKGYLLVMNEEGSDNFGGENNASGVIESVRRADTAIAAARAELARNPNTLVLVASDSSSAAMQLIGKTITDLPPDQPLPPVEENGAPIDGPQGTRSLPFLAAADRSGQRLPFYICWGAANDGSGNVLARAAGLHADRLQGNTTNSDLYRLMYLTLFGQELSLDGPQKSTKSAP